MQEHSEAGPPNGDPAPGPGAGGSRPDRLQDWIALLHDLYPPDHAEGWDAVGLHVGDLAHDTVTGVLVSLDVTPAVLEEAAEKHADLLIAHHPLLFRPLARLTTDTAAGRLALQAARAGVAVAAAHTNVDKAALGTSHPAAAALGLVDLRPLQPLPAPDRVKLVTFVPRSHTDVVYAALADAGAGVIGDYYGCSFRTPGSGSFRPGSATQPFIGTPGQLTEVEEDRVEVVVDAVDRHTVLSALQHAHPYEEVPVDLYPLLAGGPATTGLGLVGDLTQPTSLTTLVTTLAEHLRNPLVRLAALDRDRPVTRVAVVGGAGSSLVPDVLRAGAEVLVTGDVGHHTALDAMTLDLAIIDAGHWGTEWLAMRAVGDALGSAARDRGLTAPVHPSLVNTDPWTDVWT